LRVPPPNLLWIVTTQWRAQSLGHAGDVDARTPHLDRLAREGLRYAEAVTPHPFGPFARAALLTGVPSPANGVQRYHDPLPTHARTIAHDLNERGYRTAFFGKWHLAPRDPHVPLVGPDHARTLVPESARGGFGFWEGFEGGFLLNDPWLHGTRLPEPTRFAGYQSDVVTARAATWLRSGDATNPWFAVVSLEPPHPPYHAPAAGVAARDPQSLHLRPNVPRGGAVEERARHELAGYHAHLEATDRAIGRFVASLPRNTIIVFTSVHGDLHGAHGHFRKGWPYEESVRVPLIVRGAPGATSGAVSSEPVSLIDLPTMTLAWSQGRAWHCARDAAAISMPSVVELPLQCDRTWSGWRSPTRKVIHGPGGHVWLDFDLARDPDETRNRAALTGRTDHRV
jgi:arylsulfatase A-like enzyme